MKLRKVESAYKNPDRLIETLRKQVTKTTDTLKRFRAIVVKRSGVAVVEWKNTIVTQSLMGECPNLFHVGKHITQSGRIIEVLEKLNEKGQPITTFKYELKLTKIIPNIETLPEVK